MNTSVVAKTAQVPSQSVARGSSASQWFLDLLFRAWSQVHKVLASRQAAKKHLRICETAPLGDKRFVAVVQVDHERFLVGGAANSVALLAKLADVIPFPSPEQIDEGEGSPDLE
jgi:flagellar biogenesis protein FliO